MILIGYRGRVLANCAALASLLRAHDHCVSEIDSSFRSIHIHLHVHVNCLHLHLHLHPPQRLQCYTEKAPNAWHRRGAQKTGNTYNQPNLPN